MKLDQNDYLTSCTFWPSFIMIGNSAFSYAQTYSHFPEQFAKMEYHSNHFVELEFFNKSLEDQYQELFEKFYDNKSYNNQYIDVDLFEKYHNNQAVSNTSYYVLIVAYSIVIFFGSVGNLFVIIAIISNKREFMLL